MAATPVDVIPMNTTTDAPPTNNGERRGEKRHADDATSSTTSPSVTPPPLVVAAVSGVVAEKKDEIKQPIKKKYKKKKKNADKENKDDDSKGDAGEKKKARGLAKSQRANKLQLGIPDQPVGLEIFDLVRPVNIPAAFEFFKSIGSPKYVVAPMVSIHLSLEIPPVIRLFAQCFQLQIGQPI
jgi:hypothetical protein